MFPRELFIDEKYFFFKTNHNYVLLINIFIISKWSAHFLFANQSLLSHCPLEIH